MKNRERFNLQLVVASQMFSTFASVSGTFVIGWMVFELTGSKVAMGSLWLVSISAQMLVQFIIGPLIDKYKRTSVMKLTELVRMLSYGAILLFQTTGQSSVVVLYLASFLSSLAVYDAAANALIPKWVHRRILVKINAKISGLVQFARFVSFPISGLLVGMYGTKITLEIIIVLFVLSLAALVWTQEKPAKVQRKQTWGNQFKTGLAIYKNQKILLILGLFVSITSFGVFATQAMYIPYVTEILGRTSSAYGFFAAAFPLGYIAGTVIVGRLREPKALYPIMLTTLCFGGLTYIALGSTTMFWTACLIEFAAGIAMPFWNVYSSTLYHRLVTEEIMGQVLSVRFLLTKAAAPLGIVYGTFCASAYGLPALFLSVGILICLVSGAGIAFVRVFTQPSLTREEIKKNII